MDRNAFLWCLTVAALSFTFPALAQEAVWNQLKRGGQVVLVRHGLTTPGVGDPAGMKLEDCGTQRNLNDEGRREARMLGKALREQGVEASAILSSPWCRCIETARLVFGKEPRVDAALGNLFGRPELAVAQVEALKKLVVAPTGRGNVFMFTHGSTTLALTGVSPATAEMVVLTPNQGGFRVTGRLTIR